MKNCTVPGCKNTEANKFLKFYSLPYKDIEVSKEWIRRIGNPIMQNVNNTMEHKICEIHFHYVCKTGVNSQLHDGSLPTLHLPVQTSSNCFLEDQDVINYNIKSNEEINLDLEDCSDICRLCFSKGMLYNIHDSKYKNQVIFKLMQNLIGKDTSLNVTDFSTYLCLDCIKLLILSFLTIKRIRDSNLAFSSSRKLAKRKAKTKINSILVACPPKIDIKTILADCDLKIKNNKYTNKYEYTSNGENVIVEVPEEKDDSILLSESDIVKNIKCTEENVMFNGNYVDIEDVDESKSIDEIVDEERIFKCSDCGSNFSTKFLLRQHKNTKHPIFCIICGKLCRSKTALQIHLESHKDIKNFECKICQKKYKRIKVLATHIRTHHVNYYEVLNEENGTDNDNYSIKNHKGKLCAICGKVVTCMKQHLYQHSENKKYKCQYCTYSSYIKYVVTKHEDAHRGVKPYLCTQCGRAYACKTSLKKHTDHHEQLAVPIQCLYCEESFNTTYDRQIHSQRHGVNLRIIPKSIFYPKDKASVCPQCGMILTNDSTLQIHLKNVHNIMDADCFSCPYCEETFTTGYHRRYHVAREHRHKDKMKVKGRQTFARLRASPRFTCNVCSKREATKSSLRVHMRIHTGERPYKCDLCAAAFKQQQQMKNHKRRVHETERPFPCKLCERAFNTGQELDEHGRTHTGETIKCEYCDKTFKQRSNRSKHMREIHNIRIREKYSRQKKEKHEIVDKVT